jgi:hypothetical protein
MSALTEQLISARDGLRQDATARNYDGRKVSVRAAVDALADAANRICDLERELGYAYSVVNRGFTGGVFDFSVLRARAAEAAALQSQAPPSPVEQKEG